jgi:hypothetical protein
MKVLFTTLVMLYLVVDLGDPTLPGAMSFDPDDCVELVQADRAPTALPPVLAVMPTPLFLLAPLPRSPRIVRRPSLGVALAPMHALPLPPDLSSEEG